MLHVLTAILVSSTLAMADGDAKKSDPDSQAESHTEKTVKYKYKEKEVFDENDFGLTTLEGTVKGPGGIYGSARTPSEWDPMIPERSHFKSELVSALDKL